MRLLPFLFLSAILSCDGGAEGFEAGASRPEKLIRASPYPRLILEIDAVAGLSLREGIPELLVSGLEELLDKPGGIQVQIDGEIPSKGEEHAWEFDELQGLADEHFDLETPEDTIKIHIMLLDGHSADDDETGSVLGLAWSSAHLVLFKNTLGSSCEHQPPRPMGAAIIQALCLEAERAILFHELGHLIGLVNNGISMQSEHQDKERGAHSNNEECLMYWAYEGPRLVEMLREQFLKSGSGSIGFDDACLADIKAVREP